MRSKTRTPSERLILKTPSSVKNIIGTPTRYAKCLVASFRQRALSNISEEYKLTRTACHIIASPISLLLQLH